MFQNLADSSCADRAPGDGWSGPSPQKSSFACFLEAQAYDSGNEFGDYSAPLIHEVRRGGFLGVQVGSPLAPVTEYVAPAPAVVCDVSATVIEYTSSAPVIECVAPAPAVTYVVPSQQLPPVYFTTTVTTDLV